MKEFNMNGMNTNELANLSACTAIAIDRNIENLKQKISKQTSPVFISLGENCGPGTSLRECQVPSLGSNFFDNIVVNTNDVATLIRSRFSDILCLKNLIISSWEGNDSVYDRYHKIFYHHYFYQRDKEKKREQGGQLIRHIDITDVPLFLAVVRSQFEYLALKFELIAKSSIKKYYVIRRVGGQRYNESDIALLKNSLEEFGAINFDIVEVCSDGESTSYFDGHICTLIPEVGRRWGQISDWSRMVEGLR